MGCFVYNNNNNELNDFLFTKVIIIKLDIFLFPKINVFRRRELFCCIIIYKRMQFNLNTR